MKDSNYTLRFHRTAREAYGHDINFSEHGDRLVGWVALFCAGVLVGLLLGGAIW
jgi:hypothetical protein